MPTIKLVDLRTWPILKWTKHYFGLTMPQFKRCHVDNGTYFFTVNIADRKSNLLTENIDLLRDAFHSVKTRHPFRMRGWVVMPDHLHCIWTLPQKDQNYSVRWWAIKVIFSKKVRAISATNKKPIWQNRFWEHAIRNQEDFDKHLDYIHINPLKHGYVKQVRDWPYSSFHYFSSKRFYNPDWGSHVLESDDMEYGE